MAKKYRIYDPDTNRYYVTDNETRAKYYQDAIKNRYEVQTQDVGRGGLGGQLDRFGGLVGNQVKMLLNGGQLSAEDNVQNRPLSRTRFTNTDDVAQLVDQPNQTVRARDRFTGEVIDRQGQKQSSGWLDDMAAGVVDPLLDVEETMAEARYQLINKALGRGDQAEVFISPEKAKNYRERPLMTAAQDVAGVASFAVPGVGRGIVKPVTQGIVGGGLMGYSQANQEDLQEGKLDDVITGGLIGGVGGAAIHGLGHAAKKLGLNKVGSKLKSGGQALENTGDVMQASATGIKPLSAKVSGNLDFEAQLAEDMNMFKTAIKDAKLKGGLSKGNISKLAKVATEGQEEALVSKFASKVNTTGDDLINKAAQKLREMDYSLTPEQAKDLVANRVRGFADQAGYLKALGNNAEANINNQFLLTVDDIHALKQMHYPEAHKAWTAARMGNTPSQTQQIAQAIDDATKEYLYKIPNYKKNNELFVKLNQHNNSVVAADAGGNNVSNLGKLDIKDTVTKQAQGSLGRGAQKLGQKVSKLGEQLEGVKGISLPNTAASRGLGRAGLLALSRPQPELTEDRSTGLLGLSTSNDEMSNNAETDGGYSQEEVATVRRNLAKEMMTRVDSKGKPLYTPQEALEQADAVLQIEYGITPQPKLTSSQKTAVAKFDSALNGLKRLKESLNRAGLQENGLAARITGGLRNTGANLGLDPNVSVFNSQREGLLSAISKGLGESGSLSDRDIQRALNLVPDTTKSKEEAEMMLAELEDLLMQNKQSLYGTDTF